MSRKQSGLLAVMQAEIEKARIGMQLATKKTFVQYMTDTACVTLHEMGWGKDRIDNFLTQWGKTYDFYFAALQDEVETDYKRAKLDEYCKSISKDGYYKPFEERYEFLPEIRY